MCGVILFGSEHYPVYSDGFSVEDKKIALAHLKSVETFFIYLLHGCSVTCPHLFQRTHEETSGNFTGSIIWFEDDQGLSERYCYHPQ